VKVKPQKKGNNFTNTAITEGLKALGIAEESTQEELRSINLRKFYEVPASFVTTLIRKVEAYREYFTIYHSIYGEDMTEYVQAQNASHAKNQ
jgi:hypothetical protein